ncbi:MAG: TonB-dependent receptor, partial [Clostridium sp.]
NSSNQGYKTLTQFQLRYEKELAKGHRFFALVAMNEEYWNNRWFSAGRDDRIHGSLTEIDGALNTTQRTTGASDAEGLRSFLGRVNYSILDRYLFEFNFRADGSSKFLPGHQYGFFPSGSVGWRFSEENFFQPFKNIISSGKLRLSYGTLGNNSGVKKYEQKETFIGTPYALNGNNLVNGFSADKMINRDFTWEKTSVANIGFDLGFFNNQLTTEIDLYDRLTTGMIRTSQLSTLLSGYSAPRVNMGDLRNRGIELNIRWQSSINKLNYGAMFNFSYNRDKLEAWNELRNPSKIFLNMPYYFAY